MKRSTAMAAVLLPVLLMLTAVHPQDSMSAPRVFKQALPGYKFSFPKDHASHDEFKTEWWYYTGHLRTGDGRSFGYELTFFRTGAEEANMKTPGPWKLDNYYLAHFAISDENNKRFFFREKLNRSGIKTAGARNDAMLVFNETWSAEQLGDKFSLRADTPRFGIHLILEPLKPPVVHGEDGVSRKASGKGNASHYYSLTRLKTEGLLLENGKPTPVTGLSWMDHEFGSNQLTQNQVGWDWYSIQLDNGCELMLYAMRRDDGSIDPNSSGTFVFKDGTTRKLSLSEFSQKATGKWTSAVSKATYPMGWQLSVPALRLELKLTPTFEGQELSTKESTGVIYWEGSVRATGKHGSQSVSGSGYVEMTGYAEKFRKRI